MFDQFLDFMLSRWFWIPTIFFFGIFMIYLGKIRMRFETWNGNTYSNNKIKG